MTQQEEGISLAELTDILNAPHKFKNPNRVVKNRRYKAGRILLNEEIRRIQQVQEKEKLANPDLPAKDKVTYFTLAAPPSLRPIRTYCDITGLPTQYKSPHNQIRYFDRECYDVVKSMPPGVDQQYLSLRGANIILK